LRGTHNGSDRGRSRSPDSFPGNRQRDAAGSRRGRPRSPWTRQQTWLQRITRNQPASV